MRDHDFFDSSRNILRLSTIILEKFDLDVCKVVYDGEKLFSIDGQDKKIRKENCNACVNNRKFTISPKTSVNEIPQTIYDTVRTLTIIVKCTKRGYIIDNVDRFIDLFFYNLKVNKIE